MYKGIINAIPKYWKFALKTEGLLDDSISKYEQLVSRNKVSNVIYKELQETDKISIKCCQDFQRRLLLNKIFCNDLLVHWNKVESNICNLCKIEKQTIIHLFIECTYSKRLWKAFSEVMNELKFAAKYPMRPITKKYYLY